MMTKFIYTGPLNTSEINDLSTTFNNYTTLKNDPKISKKQNRIP